ncbi:hypothetical protein EGX94_04815 [Propionibacterium acidifaciens]|nr:hypothetical protein EGX94_04815 [Propionibacterium acidifaciens]
MYLSAVGWRRQARWRRFPDHSCRIVRGFPGREDVIGALEQGVAALPGSFVVSRAADGETVLTVLRVAALPGSFVRQGLYVMPGPATGRGPSRRGHHQDEGTGSL